MLLASTGDGKEAVWPLYGQEHARGAAVGRLTTGKVCVAIEVDSKIMYRVSDPCDLHILPRLVDPSHESFESSVAIVRPLGHALSQERDGAEKIVTTQWSVKS